MSRPRPAAEQGPERRSDRSPGRCPNQFPDQFPDQLPGKRGNPGPGTVNRLPLASVMDHGEGEPRYGKDSRGGRRPAGRPDARTAGPGPGAGYGGRVRRSAHRSAGPLAFRAFGTFRTSRAVMAGTGPAAVKFSGSGNETALATRQSGMEAPAAGATGGGEGR